jgi:hypothetical protein
MEILCPNCQRKLTIAEQHAGMPVRCPLCANTFIAPALPPSPPAAGGTYGLQPPPPPPPPPADSRPPLSKEPAGNVPAEPGMPPSPAPAPIPTDYTGRFSVWISPRITQYIPGTLLLLVFFLTFFPWVAIRPGGVWLESQSAWQAVIGSVSLADKDAEQLSWFKGKQRKETLPQPMAGQAEGPGWDFLVFLYLPLLMLNLLVTAFAATTEYSDQYLPLALKPYVRWRWAAATLLTVVSFALLLLQSTVGFSLERRAGDAVSKVTQSKADEWNKMQKEGELKGMEAREIPVEVEIFRGTYQKAFVRTFWYRCAFWFHFWALIFVCLTMLGDLRGAKPCPRVDVLW